MPGYSPRIRKCQPRSYNCVWLFSLCKSYASFCSLIVNTFVLSKRSQHLYNEILVCVALYCFLFDRTYSITFVRKFVFSLSIQHIFLPKIKKRSFSASLMAPQEGLEPTTLRLTAECSAIELLRNIEIRQRPNLPGRVQPSTFGAKRLNFCVRNGNRWNPLAITTGKGMR